MTEMLLNLVWLALAATAFMLTPNRSRRVTSALICAVALLFPIISISDDFSDRDATDDLVGLVVALFVVSAMLVALASIERERRSPAPLRLVVLSDPRSPPRG